MPDPLLNILQRGLPTALATLLLLTPTSARSQQTVFATYPGTPPVIAVGLGTQVRVFRFSPQVGSYEEIWTSASTGRFLYENADTHWQMAFGDVDGDGSEELVSVDQLALNIWGRRGSSPLRTVLSTVPESHASLAVADADGDGRPEILVGWHNFLQVWRYEDGQVIKLDELQVGPSRMEMIWNINVADLDGNGDKEILLGGTLLIALQDALRIAYFDGHGLVHGDFIPIRGAADVTRVYDWDRDGLPEIFTSGNSQVVQGYGWDPKEVRYTRFWTGPDLKGYVQGLAVGDLDGDGHDELVAGTYVYPDKHPGGPTLTFFTERDGVPVLELVLPCEQVGFPGLLIADLDGDLRPELLLNGNKIYRAMEASGGSRVYGLVDRIGHISPRPGEVQPNAAVSADFSPSGATDRTPFIIVQDLQVLEGGRGRRVEVGRLAALFFQAQNLGGEADEVLFRLVSDDPRIQVVDALARFSFVNAQTNLDNRVKPFLLQVREDAAPGPVTLRIEVSAQEGYRTVREFPDFVIDGRASPPPPPPASRGHTLSEGSRSGNRP